MKTNTKLFDLFTALALLLPINALAEEHEIDQRNKEFSHQSVSVKVGDQVKFTNSDSFFHNVYSLSEKASFDLGSYPKGESKSVTFDEAGEVVAQCAIHPQMRLVINVEEKDKEKGEEKVQSRAQDKGGASHGS